MASQAVVELPPILLALVALFCGAWFAVATWATLTGLSRRRAAAASLLDLAKAEGLLAASPAIPVAVSAGKVEMGSHAHLRLGFDTPPVTIEQLQAAFEVEDGTAFADHIQQACSAGGSFVLTARPAESKRAFLVQGGPAPAPYPAGTALLWFIDVTSSEAQLDAMRGEVARLGAGLDSLSALIELAPFPIWHRGPDLGLAMVNSAYVAAVEAEDARAVVRDGIELVDEGEEGSAAESARVAREKGEPVARTVPATISGERRMLRVVEVPLGEGGIAGYAIDVEDREQARAELTRFARAQRDMLDRLSAGVAQFGRDRSLIFSNQPFTRLFSLEAEWLADHPEFDRVLDRMREGGNLPEVRDFPDWKESKRSWFTSGLAAEEEDWLLPGGKHLRVVAQPLPDGGLLLIFEDRTEQIQLASARDTLLRVRTATFDNLFEAVGVFASDGRLHLWNNRFRDLWQFEEEQLSGHPRVDTLTPHLAKKLKTPSHAGLMRELVRAATVERKQRKGRVSLVDGRDFEFAAVPLPDGNALFTMLDITDARVIETALRERNEALEEADRLKTAFVSNMSYELRTPLTSIGGFAEMLAEGYAGALPPQAVDYVAAILDAVARLGALIDNVLDLTQSDSGSLLLAEDEVDLGMICREAAAAFEENAQRKEIELAVEIEPAVGAVTGDQKRLRQALDNLLRNAFAYTDRGGKVLLHASGSAAEAEIRVTDNGKGISPADQARVFDRFHRAAVDESGEEAALGLGLPLAKQFIEAHGGSIELQSDVGRGTQLTVRLPRNRHEA